MTETTAGPTAFRKKPIQIEAIRYRGPEDKHLVRDFVSCAIDEVGTAERPGLHIETLEGWSPRLARGLDHPRREGRVLPLQARHLRGHL